MSDYHSCVSLRQAKKFVVQFLASQGSMLSTLPSRKGLGTSQPEDFIMDVHVCLYVLPTYHHSWQYLKLQLSTVSGINGASKRVALTFYAPTSAMLFQYFFMMSWDGFRSPPTIKECGRLPNPFRIINGTNERGVVIRDLWRYSAKRSCLRRFSLKKAAAFRNIDGKQTHAYA